MSDLKKQLEIIKQGIEEIIGEDDLVQKLKDNKTLTIKVGFDPTAPDLHLGHTVLLRKMRQLQDLGHKVIFLIGDFTGKIGDPTGKNKTRPPLTDKEIEENAKTYQDQVFKVLDKDKTVVDFNSRWGDKMSGADMIKLAAQSTVARMIERDDFSKRFKNNQPISIHEFLYPLMQGYDSVELEADMELGGTDQKFNLLVGRDLQKSAGSKPQTIMTLPLLEGLDGVKKMSKSEDNYIGITESADQIFGKTMSIPDDVMFKWFDLLSFRSPEEISSLKKEIDNGANPRDAKIMLALELAERFTNNDEAMQAQENFSKKFAKNELPSNIEEKAHKIDQMPALPNLLKDLGMVSSTSDALRLIQQGAVKINQQKVEDKDTILDLNEKTLLQVGKKKYLYVTLSK
ncbi:MAG: tyrosine--tRNA ligase [Gammaproteobacteria bacterium]|jgi:tyrosyl-tRNA synthetase|nr:MAG: tyrosine--tRNA ligase [Gammaproteobacteria bacterium]|tara:strand:+ start:236 stop:1435 length:1200 start_codon:yes stop_codon:yes gene_type:complete